MPVCVKSGVQLKTPVNGLKIAPVGKSLADRVISCPLSGSDAVTVKLKSSFSLRERFPIFESSGALLTSPTLIVTSSSSVRGGAPLS